MNRSSPYDIAVVGHACRLPGASDVTELWALLRAGGSAVSDAPVGRWPVERALHPRRTEPGFSYTFAGGYIADPFAFDPSVFGISPREAQQIDPQQRLLLEVVWEALEDAGLPPSRTARQDIGVYVGASNVDYQAGASGDPAAIESHFMTGNSLSIVSNRISYIFDWRGPSFTVDSACSSSFVALAQAAAALEAGMIDTAVVAGVNLLLSPAPFIGFSRASMLSPTGRCRPFSAAADGYVRSEGAIALVVRRGADARGDGSRIHAQVVAAGVNSDGRTSGISLPSIEGQSELMGATYRSLGIGGDALAFVEAHGTGTPVGDPIEARAIGGALAVGRAAPLPVGSVKSNIGHLECVSGLAGFLKASLALKHRVLPRTLHLEQLNPNIPFTELNLDPARAETILDPVRTPFAGICNYGFGGTNAHVVLRAPDDLPALPDTTPEPASARFLALSARSQDALRALAGAYAGRLEAGDAAPAEIAGAARHQRDLLDQRLAVPVSEPAAMASALRRFARGDLAEPGVASGKATPRTGKAVFVYSGNGAQWVGMGRAAYARNAAYRACFGEVDRLYMQVGGWSLVAALHAGDLADRIAHTSVAQPLIFAIQTATTAALAEEGLAPDIVLGHSVGDVAAALASGALDLESAVHLIHHRSLRQESVAGRGRMIALAAGEEQAAAFVDDLGSADLEIAAVNGPRSVTLSGSEEAIVLAEKAARLRRLATVQLGIDYPFHSHLLDGAEAGIRDDLRALAPRDTRITFVSTVTGDVLPGTALGASYWWRNIRNPVRFADALARAGALGGTHFLEIGPRPILVSAAGETLRQAGYAAECFGSLSERDDEGDGDPVRATAARAFVRGMRMDEARAFGPAPGAPLPLPHYPWQRQRFILSGTSEALDLYGATVAATPTHPLLGRRVSAGVPEWLGFIDSQIIPYLADHKVEGEAVVPGAALAEMMLAVGREAFGAVPVELSAFDILRPLTLAEGSMREVSTRLDEATHTCEIWARRRLGGGEFALHATGHLAPAAGKPVRLPPPDPGRLRAVAAETIYAAAIRCGLDYGPSFRKVLGTLRDDDGSVSRLATGALPLGMFQDLHVIDPTSLDAALHPLFLDARLRDGEVRTHLPVRIGALRLWQARTPVTESILRRRRENRFTSSVDITLIAADGSVVAEVEGLVLREVVLARRNDAERLFRMELEPVRIALAAPASGPAAPPAPPLATDALLLLRAFVRSQAYETARRLAVGDDVSPATLVAHGRLSPEAQDRFTPLLDHLATYGLAVAAGPGWRLLPAELPASTILLRTLVARFPEANAEIRLAAHFQASLPDALEKGVPWRLPAALAEQFEEDGLAFRAGLDAIRRTVTARIAACAPARPHVVVARPWTAGLMRTLLPFMQADAIRVTLAGADGAAFDRIASRSGMGALGFLDTTQDDTHPTPADVVVGVASGGLFGGDPSEGARLAALAAGAHLAVVHPAPDPALDLLLGASAAPHLVPSRAELEALLQRIGGLVNEAELLADGASALLTGTLPATASAPAPAPVAVLWSGAARAFAQLIREAEPGTTLLGSGDALPARPTGGALVVPVAFEPDPPARTGLASALMDLKAVFAKASAAGDAFRLWIVTARGRTAEGAALDPRATAVCAFARVAMNEHPGLDIRLIDVDAFDAEAARRVLGLVRLDSPETERVSTRQGERAARVLRGAGALRAEISDTLRVRLDVPQQGALGSMEWCVADRIAPSDGEIEIEVAATGLNFRDVMLALGALDDDILGPGLTGASLGFECAGTVVRVGRDAGDHKVGDTVMGFAPDAFSSHVTVPAWFAFPIPDGVPPEAAAAVPVAFATAWYALVECARLAPGETVLVHGAAGGVGLAAVEIAHSRGARVIATAGTPEKAALLRALGVEAVFNSRDLAFAREIAQAYGAVDVVLNSLAGPAMAASLRLVKPFGRFVELGKRDFLANTAVGLRPFARNLSYFGIDLDQLLAHDPGRAKAMMRDIGAAFADGTLKPISYRVVAGEAVEDAFRQMQAARHVGKLVVRPPREGRVRPAPAPALALREGVHLVVGGTRGFGFETALFLAARTMGVVVVASRAGACAPEIEARIDAARRAGARIVIERLDARDADAVAALVARLVAEHGPLRGIYHTAMVLEDGIIQNLTPESLASVLAPKVDGVVALDRVTQAHPVDQFVVYSSASAMIGSPGQGAYVAANAFLEGVVRNRRARGESGLAVAWGAISDAGVLAQDEALGLRLQRATGVAGIPARDALAFLQRLMAQGGEAEPVNVYAQVNQTAIASQLSVLKTPSFPRLFAGTAHGTTGESGNLQEQLEGRTDAEALGLLCEVLARETAAILRLPADAVDAGAVLSDLGMDSLMALELRLTLEKKFGLELPLLGIGGGRTLADLAGLALAGLRGAPAAQAPAATDGADPLAIPAPDAALIAQHGIRLDADGAGTLLGAIEEKRTTAGGLP
ncbi:SDR family NAD(P)-dependent oxidoreductase [Xanthobacter dioxanivorans]|uniref:SDR family NAD(P)-dependent oxidoreductase n=1 Tax=Xanthobacter dioxanivorans TaxID=2528964 RepID=A0A974SH25_9HYPH|nr:type I polyketide synthase [Xanthobacter dioxanivorans]QRG05275.1 SDR family NAD(P)-dependent oxidoreductase [Xanthobacter dioxanivorans]